MLCLLGYIRISLADDRTALPEGVDVEIGG